MAEPLKVNEKRHTPTPLQGLERALEQLDPLIEVVDEELVVASGRSVDLVALDSSGRILLILVLGRCDDEDLLRALDAIAFGEGHAPLLAKHYKSASSSPGSEFTVMIVGEGLPPSFVLRLQALHRERVRAFELHTLRSKRGESIYLVPVEGLGGTQQNPSAHSFEDFLKTLSPRARSRVEGIDQRLRRIDDRLAASALQGEITWTCGEDPLCMLKPTGGQIEGRLATQTRGQALESEGAIEEFLDQVLALFLQRQFRPAAGENGQNGAGNRSAQGLPSLGEILTPEEIAAFEQAG